MSVQSTDYSSRSVHHLSPSLPFLSPFRNCARSAICPHLSHIFWIFGSAKKIKSQTNRLDLRCRRGAIYYAILFPRLPDDCQIQDTATLAPPNRATSHRKFGCRTSYSRLECHHRYETHCLFPEMYPIRHWRCHKNVGANSDLPSHPSISVCCSCCTSAADARRGTNPREVKGKTPQTTVKVWRRGCPC